MVRRHLPRLHRLPPPPRLPWRRVNRRVGAFGTVYETAPLGYRRIYWLHRRRFVDRRVRSAAMRLRARVRQRLNTQRNLPGGVINNIMAYAGW